MPPEHWEDAEVWDEVDIGSVRAKSLALTDFFLECGDAYLPGRRPTCATPAAHAERGSQIALRCADAGEVMRGLVSRGVVGDFRRPDVLRFGFTPLYTGFADTERAARVLADCRRRRTGRAVMGRCGPVPGSGAGRATAAERYAADLATARAEEAALLELTPRPPQRSVRYGPHPSQVIDHFLPSDRTVGRVKALHGGFWREAYDRAHLSPFAAAWAERGVVG